MVITIIIIAAVILLIRWLVLEKGYLFQGCLGRLFDLGCAGGIIYLFCLGGNWVILAIVIIFVAIWKNI